MPGKDTTNNVMICSFTKDTIRQMLSYKTDEQIAAHVRAPLSLVEQVRRNVRGDGGQRHHAATPEIWKLDGDHRDDIGGGEWIGFCIAQRKADARFVKALGRVG